MRHAIAFYSLSHLLLVLATQISSDDFSPDTKFVERFNQLRKINKFTDCSFKVENRSLSCHKLILCAASPVFEAMLYSKFLEGSEYSMDASNSIRITDISYETFDLFLSYLYTGELVLKGDGNEMAQLMELSYCAQKYLIEDMRKQCLNKLTEFLNNDTILMFLGKSFDMHLEDFLVSCLYFIAETIEAGSSLINLILNNENFHLVPRCFEFLVKNLLDYLDERDDVLCLIKAWTFMQCHVDNFDYSDDSQTVTMRKLNLDDPLIGKIVQMKSCNVDPAVKLIKSPRSFYRVDYKPVKPLIIEESQLSFDTNISFKRFATINSLTVNSRLIPEQYDISDMSNQTYTENVTVEIIDKSSTKALYKHQHSVGNVSFNAFFRIDFADTIILFPHHVYVIKLTWNIEATGYEYPRCIFSLMEKGSETKTDANKNPLSIVQFHEYTYSYNTPFGSIVQGISYDLTT